MTYRRRLFQALLVGGLVLVGTRAWGQPSAGYYADAIGKSGQALRQALHGIIDQHQVWGYDDAHRWIDLLDEDPTDATRVRTLYARTPALKSSWPEYNREHVWPQSLGAERRPAKSDMHHIFAEDADVNSSRGNKPFDDCTGNCRSHGQALAAKYSSTHWEPPSEVKGDIARALFYMDVRYEGGGGEPDLKLIEELPSAGCNCMGKLSTLLKWHAADAPDETERRRNNEIHTTIQRNRNPFVDHPEWVSAIWGGPSPTPAPGTGPVVVVPPGVQESVRLESESHLGVPLHRSAGGSSRYDRVPNGTMAGVTERAIEGRWLHVTIPDGRDGWVSHQYVAAFSSPSPAGESASPSAPPDGAFMLAHFIDVGQANATLLEFPCGAVLIDAGAQGEAQVNSLVQYLQGFFSRRTDLSNTLESVILTHNHIDHTRALRQVVNAFQVRRVLEHGKRGGPRDPGDPPVDWVKAEAGARGIQFRVVRDADITALATREGLSDPDIDPIACPGVDPRLRILSASIDTENQPNWTAGEFGDKNNHSIVTRVDFGQASFLFTGDLEEPAIETMVGYYQGTNTLDVDVWEVGHHGSHNGTTWSLLQAMTPDLAVVSMGRWDDQQPWTAWQYGHPRHDALSLIKDAITVARPPIRVHIARGQKTFYETAMEDAIYATGWEGTIVLRAFADGKIEKLTGPIP